MTLAIERVEVRYGARVAVEVASLALSPGHLVALVGPNGAGKSSLLKALAGVVRRTGRIAWNGQDLGPLHARARARTVAYLPQAPAAHWPLRARELVGLGRLPHRALGQTESATDHAAVDAAMQQTEVTALADRNVDELSGGERSRVLLARALAVRAPVLVVDEPIASLDPYHQLQIMAALKAYARGADGEQALVVAVLHDLALAARFCSRVVLLHEGKVVGDGTSDSVLNANTLRRYYRVAAHIGEHEGQSLIVPWQRID
jgi:iron complex transport system ATP-binding protein